MLKNLYNAGNYKLKYDYTDKKVLGSIQDLASLEIPYFYEQFYTKVNYPFLDYLSVVLSSFDNEELINFFASIYLKTKVIYDKNLDIDDCKASMSIGKNGNLTFSVHLPELDHNTNTLYAAFIHELAHFSMMLGNSKKDYYEYSEVPSMFFEYLMYEGITPSYGYSFFVNNRMSSLKNGLSDIKSDLVFAENPGFLCLSQDVYQLPLASAISYPEGVEYVLNLIDLMKSNEKDVYKSISKIILGESTCREEAKRLDIDTSKYKKIKKLTKM